MVVDLIAVMPYQNKIDGIRKDNAVISKARESQG